MQKGPAIEGQPFLCQQKENDILLTDFDEFNATAVATNMHL